MKSRDCNSNKNPRRSPAVTPHARTVLIFPPVPPSLALSLEGRPPLPPTAHTPGI